MIDTESTGQYPVSSALQTSISCNLVVPQLYFSCSSACFLYMHMERTEARAVFTAGSEPQLNFLHISRNHPIVFANNNAHLLQGGRCALQAFNQFCFTSCCYIIANRILDSLRCSIYNASRLCAGI